MISRRSFVKSVGKGLAALALGSSVLGTSRKAQATRLIAIEQRPEPEKPGEGLAGSRSAKKIVASHCVSAAVGAGMVVPKQVCRPATYRNQARHQSWKEGPATEHKGGARWPPAVGSDRIQHEHGGVRRLLGRKVLEDVRVHGVGHVLHFVIADSVDAPLGRCFAECGEQVVGSYRLFRDSGVNKL
jgi:hypothetical protein